jgi:hypothetical protein
MSSIGAALPLAGLRLPLGRLRHPFVRQPANWTLRDRDRPWAVPPRGAGHRLAVRRAAARTNRTRRPGRPKRSVRTTWSIGADRPRGLCRSERRDWTCGSAGRNRRDGARWSAGADRSRRDYRCHGGHRREWRHRPRRHNGSLGPTGPDRRDGSGWYGRSDRPRGLARADRPRRPDRSNGSHRSAGVVRPDVHAARHRSGHDVLIGARSEYDDHLDRNVPGRNEPARWRLHAHVEHRLPARDPDREQTLRHHQLGSDRNELRVRHRRGDVHDPDLRALHRLKRAHASATDHARFEVLGGASSGGKASLPTDDSRSERLAPSYRRRMRSERDQS